MNRKQNNDPPVGQLMRTPIAFEGKAFASRTTAKPLSPKDRSNLPARLLTCPSVEMEDKTRTTAARMSFRRSIDGCEMGLVRSFGEQTDTDIRQWRKTQRQQNSAALRTMRIFSLGFCYHRKMKLRPLVFLAAIILLSSSTFRAGFPIRIFSARGGAADPHRADDECRCR